MSGRMRGARFGVAVVALAVLAGCASADESSFRPVADAHLQARAWVDAAMASSIPTGSTVLTKAIPDGPDDGGGHSEGPDSCTSSADFAQMSYSRSVDVPADQVDASVAAIWGWFREMAFGGSTVGTEPVAPGPGSPSWTVSMAHDGFTVEITGARTEPTYVSTYIVTPCLRTS